MTQKVSSLRSETWFLWFKALKSLEYETEAHHAQTPWTYCMYLRKPTSVHSFKNFLLQSQGGEHSFEVKGFRAWGVGSWDSIFFSPKHGLGFRFWRFVDKGKAFCFC